MSSTIPQTLAAPAAARRAPKWFSGLRGNLLIQNDWRALKRGWRRSPLVWGLILFSVAHVALNAAIALVLDLDDDEFGYLIYYFGGLHFLLQFVLPWRAFEFARRPAIRSRIEACLLAPVEHRHIFWWLWTRSFVPAMALIAVIYLPLVIAYPWLYAVDIVNWEIFTDNPPIVTFRFFRETFFEFSFVLLIALPWIRRRPLRRGIWVFSALALFLIPMFMLHSSSSTEPYALHAHFHPLITVPYFLITAAFACALGVGVAIHTRLEAGRALVALVLLGPLAEWIALNLFYLGDAGDLYDGWMFLMGMLQFYMYACGYLWMGLKWNLIFHLSRRRIPTR